MASDPPVAPRPSSCLSVSGCLPWRRPQCLSSFGAYGSNSPTTGCLSRGRWAFCGPPCL
ncbi:hypothetical protein BDP55DRAFT_652715 [Colletotrichum godetiae]|uniref:Uncharacterized protein n=1 Tax=Colletotrichum godetiae TaxID=1209918 RepID=A0AAJ0ATH9_9PEZI|nr:uncharacterized protein BDP55DRAFT_652715 [Colletotrichum godetiae]KAK1690081.1 hypothetical protein BDP55DRAFT_652715 [Colletotrichum godetiae]